MVKKMRCSTMGWEVRCHSKGLHLILFTMSSGGMVYSFNLWTSINTSLVLATTCTSMALFTLIPSSTSVALSTKTSFNTSAVSVLLTSCSTSMVSST